MNNNNYVVDGLLVLQHQSGNRKALPLLVKRWHRKFCSKAYWVTNDRDIAKDIAQDSWKTIISKLDGLDDPNSFGSWALTIVYRKSIDWIRANKMEVKTLHEFYYNHIVTIDESNDNENLNKALLKAIRALPIKQQIVINLFYVEAYSLKQISKILNISVGTVKSRLFHAREKLKLTLKQSNYEN